MEPCGSNRCLGAKGLSFAGLGVGALGLLLAFRPWAGIDDSPGRPTAGLAVVILGAALAAAGLLRSLRPGVPWLARAFSIGVALAFIPLGWLFKNAASLPVAEGAPAVGTVAPDFALASSDGTTFRLSERRGRKLLLVFFRGAW